VVTNKTLLGGEVEWNSALIRLEDECPQACEAFWDGESLLSASDDEEIFVPENCESDCEVFWDGIDLFSPDNSEVFAPSDCPCDCEVFAFAEEELWLTGLEELSSPQISSCCQ